MTDASWDRLCNSAHQDRVDRVQLFGFSARQARFLTLVLVHGGVFLERQYRRFAGIAHGQKTHDFLHQLVARGYARAITPGALHRETAANSEDEKDLDDWLGGRDSNPDTVVQSHVSYRWTTSQCWLRATPQEPSIIAARKICRQLRASVSTGSRSLSRHLAHRTLRSRIGRTLDVARGVGLAWLLLLFAAMARHPALASCFSGLFARPLVSSPFLVRRLAALARNLSLLGPIHRCETAILFSHRLLPPRGNARPGFRTRRAPKHTGCNRCATDPSK